MTSRQRVSKETVARQALQEFEPQIQEYVARGGDAGVRGVIERHLMRLPRQYGMDVSYLDDILVHAEILSRAERDAKDGTTRSGVWCHAREVDVSRGGADGVDAMDDDGEAMDPNGMMITRSGDRNALRGPTFGSSVTLSTLGDGSGGGASSSTAKGTYEVSVSAGNKPRLLSRVSAALFEVGLNIAEAHVFCTDDGFALDIFIVTGWKPNDAATLTKSIQASLDATDFDDAPKSSGENATATSEGRMSNHAGGSNVDVIAIDGGEWELTEKQLVFNEKIASGAFGLLYRGSYCGQEVAIKVLKSNVSDGPVSDTLREFAQELNILRRVHHKNILQLIGALTKSKTLCLVTEFMRGGNLLQYVQEHAPLKVADVVRYSLGVALGLDYLHKINIVHRDIKTANMLLDDNNVVKIADFGVARVQAGDGVTMTAETGTYRWMAPEVIAHQFYNEKCDVYSYGIMVWELVSGGEVPYPGYTPLQAAVGVVQRGLRPTISPGCNSVIAQVMQYCWLADMSARPGFEQIIALLRNIQVPQEDPGKHGFFDRLRSVSFKSKK